MIGPFAVFSLFLMFFHISEYLLASIFNPKDLGWDSLLLSKPYCVAMCFGTLEYWAEQWLCPEFKRNVILYLFWIGCFMVVSGELLRKTGMITAGASFTHLIKVVRRTEHALITHGIYSYMRHPGYVGWFLWAVGTQLLLGNIIASVVFTVVTWRFFSHRVPYEESALRHMFGREYVEYAALVPSGLPFI